MNDLISRAERFARVCHEGQFRKGKAKEPYVSHLEEVAKLTERWGEERMRSRPHGYTILSKIVRQHL